MASEEPRCDGCGLPYDAFPLDVVLPDAEWRLVHPEGEGGLLCVSCIAERASKLPKMVVLYARLVTLEDHDAFTAIKNVPLKRLAAPRG